MARADVGKGSKGCMARLPLNGTTGPVSGLSLPQASPGRPRESGGVHFLRVTREEPFLLDLG